MATALEQDHSVELSKQISQVSMCTLDSVIDELSDIDSIVNKCWKFEEVFDLLQSQLAILPGGRDKNGGAIIVMQGVEGQTYLVSNVGKVLSYLSKIPNEQIQGQGFTIILDMRQATWSQMKKALESLRLTFVEHIHHVIIMKPKSLWQRGRTTMNFNIKKTKYKFKCTLLEHSSDIFQHVSIAHVPKSQNGQLEYDHDLWMDIQKTSESYMLQLVSKRSSYISLQDILEKPENPSSLEEAREVVKYHISLHEQLDKSGLDNLCATINHTIARLRPTTSNPDFENSFIHLEEICGSLQSTLVELEKLWELKGDKLDRVLQFRTFENDAAQHVLWLRDQGSYLSRELTKIGTSVSLALAAKEQVEDYRRSVNSKHSEINRVIEVGQRLISLNHPSSEMINSQSDEIGEKWEGLTDMIEERMALVILSVNFHTKEDKFVQQSEGWTDECSSKFCPPDITSTEEAIEKHKKLRESYSDLYTSARQDGHALIEKLRRPIGEGSVPPDFILAVRHIKEVLENLYDEKNLVDEQWQGRQDHLKMTYNFRVFQKDTEKILHWINEIGNPFLVDGTSIGVDVNSATALLKAHDSFESDSETPVVYSQCNLLQSRAKELIATKECRKGEVEEEANKLEETINNFATRLDDRRDVLVLAIECFKAFDNFMGEGLSLSNPIPKERFEGDHLELEERLARFRARHNILQKISSSTLKLWDSLKHRLKSSALLGESSGCPINLSPASRTVEERVKKVEKERDRLASICQKREKRWELSLDRHNLVKDMEEYSLQLSSWLQGIDPKGDLGDNITDAQSQLEIFERQYKQQKEKQDSLITRGKEINGVIDQLDQEMFGTKCVKVEVQEVVNKMVQKIEKERDRMIKEAGPHLNLLKECLQYHLLNQRSHNLNATLNQISSSLSRLVGVGHNLNDARSLEQSVKDTEETLQETSQDVKIFMESIADCVKKNCYQSASLNILSRSLSEKLALVKRNMLERQRVVKSAFEFHSNYDKLHSTMEYCQAQFSSREYGKSLVDINRQQQSMKELKESLTETVEVVKNQAEHLINMLSIPEQTNGKVTSDDISEDNPGPRLLVIPKRARPQDKDRTSSKPSSQPDQLIVEDMISKMNARISRLNRLWDSRHTRLEQSKQIIEFEGEVPKVLKWLDETGAAFLENRHDYGRSLEEVEKLLKNYDTFQRDLMAPMAKKVDELKKMMNQFEESGHYELNRIRSIGSHLEQQWNRFESDVKTRSANLKMSLSFQENLFQGSNWCMKSEQFLHSLDEKINQCDTSDEAKNLSAELSVYLSVTQKEQAERVSKIQEISGFLHSNPLNELSTQLEHSTTHMLKDFENVQQDLEMLHDKLVQIEKEKDREMRLLKQKERVIEELITTEEVYVNDLKLVVETYKPRFISEFLPESLKGKETIVFGNIQWIAEFHIEVIWPQLQSVDVTDANAVAQVFIQNAEVMTDLYVPYCQNKTNSEELLASHRSYLNRVSSLFGSDIPLSSLLIKPIQRITKYPLLLKDCLKYTKQLGQPTELLELALHSVEEIPVQTNNAIHLGLLRSEEGLKWHKYGDLLYQGTLLVSEPRLLITSEKERQVFVFENTVVFARRVELGQAKFHYDYKFRIPLTAGVQVLEFIEGEPCKFALFTSDHRMHLKANSIDIKNDWVKSLRIAIHKHIESENNKLRSLSVSTNRIRSNALTTDVVAKDLSEKHPKTQFSSRPSSPFSVSRINMPINETSTSPPLVTFERYKVISDYVPLENDQHGLSLKKNQTVEVMEQLETGRWFIRATTITGQVEHGWVPSNILEQLPPNADNTPQEESVDYGTRRHTTAAFDNTSQQVISNLKRVTIGQSSPIAKKTKQLVVQPSPRLGMSTRKSPGRSPSPLPPPSPNKVAESETNLDKSPAGGRFRRKVVVRRKSSTKSNSSSISESDPQVEIDRHTDLNVIHDSSSDEELNIQNLSPAPSPLPSSSPPSPNVIDVEEEKIKREKAEEKIRYILAELYETEKEYVSKLEKLINGFLKSVQEDPNLPEALQGKERTIFGNVAAIYEFHRDVFQELIENAKDSQEAIAQCFLDRRSDFKLYVTYCEHKPKSESFVWTYTHQGGMFFTDVQKKLNLREDIASFLIKPVQRITKYQLLLKDLFKTSQKAGKDVPLLEEALQLMQDVPKQANDAMALSMIVGYHGNIHANGQIILQDEFVIYEKSRWTVGSHRHVFLLDLMMIITKEKDNDGLYMFKDTLKVHNMTLTEKQADNPCRFAIGTGQIGDWDKYYIFEATSNEKKLEWVRTIKEILNQQFEMLKALKQPTARNRSATVDTNFTPSNDSPHVRTTSIVTQQSLFGDMSDSSLDDNSDVEQEPTTPVRRSRSSALSVGDTEQILTKQPPYTVASKPLQLYIAGDSYCPPPVEGRKIFHIRKGQIYNVTNTTGDWWQARLIRAVSPSDATPGTEGWVPPTFMDPYHGSLTVEERLCATENKQSVGKFSTLPVRTSLSNPLASPRLNLFTSLSSKSDDKKKLSKRKSKSAPNVPQIVSFLSDESILCGRDVQFKCRLGQEYPDQIVEWLHNGEPVQIDRAFSSAGENCVLKITSVCPEDEGLYTCVITVQSQKASTTARLTVLGPPNPPGKPDIKQLTSTSVSLSWSQPSFDGHSPITIYLVECKDVLGDRWSTLMKRVTEPATIVDDLVPGMEYSFRVIAGNHIGSSVPSEESTPIKMIHRSPLKPVFSLEPFDNHYTVMGKIAKGQFGTVHECLHEATQQTYVAKLLPIAVGQEHCQHELSMLVLISHPNIVQMIAAYLTERHYVIIMQYAHGVHIYEYFTQKTSVPEYVIAKCCQQLVGALEYLHNKDIAHLAIKPDHLLVWDKLNDNLELKVLHFSRARVVSEKTVIVPSDSLEDEAPEILLKEPVCVTTDMWSVGILLYTLLCGVHPFFVDSLDLTKENIKKARFSMSSRLFKGVSSGAKSVISQLLQRLPSERLTSSQFLKHSWIKDASLTKNLIDMKRLQEHLQHRTQQ